MRKPVAVVLLILLAAGVARGQHIHLLLIADTADPSIGECSPKTIDKIQGMLGYLVPPDRYTLAVKESGRQHYGSADSVLKLVQDVPVGKNDTFVFLYDGHGARAEGHHFLIMPDGGRLGSADLQKAVDAKPCKLRIILTGSCNVPVQRDGIAAAAVEVWDVQKDGIAPVMEELFVNHTGLMHMNGAAPGQFGFTSEMDGNWFFAEFAWYCTLCPSGRPTWKCMDRILDENLAGRFRRVYNGKYVEPGTGYTQTTLTTITWSLPKPIDHPTSRFGVVAAENRAKTGVVVTSVDPNGPARGVLARGDLIVAINGQDVTDTDSFFVLARSSSKTMHYTYRRGNASRDAEAKLRW
jgi:hypothetical protein